MARTTPLFSNFLFTNLFPMKFLYFFIISSLFSYFNLFEARILFSDLLSDHYLACIADKIGDVWRQFFIHLGFETEKMHHWEHDNPGCLLKTILAGLHEWKKEPPIKIPNRNIKELLDWIITALRKRERQDIADELKEEREQLGKTT